MSQFLRRGVPLLITSALILFLLAEYFVPYQPLEIVGSQIRSWGVVIAAFLMPIGMITLVMRNIVVIQRRQKNWPYYLWSLICLGAMIGFGLIGGIGRHPTYIWLYNNIIVHTGQTMYAILAFFITTAIFRAFRMRNIESALVLVSGFFVIMAIAPAGAVIWSGFPVIGGWIQNVPNMAGMRGIVIGIGLGVLSTGIRTILGLEKGQIGGEAGTEMA